MKRQFSRREKILLLILAVLLLGVLYYMLVDQPVRDTVADANSRQSAAESELLIDTAKLMQMRQMQSALDELSADSKAIVPDYDNAQQVVNLLNKAMLYADSYDLSFRSIAVDGQIVSRPIDLNFTCADYSAAKAILTVLHDGPYRCDITAFTIAENDSLEAEEYASVAEGSVKCSLTATFYEFLAQ